MENKNEENKNEENLIDLDEIIPLQIKNIISEFPNVGNSLILSFKNYLKQINDLLQGKK